MDKKLIRTLIRESIDSQLLLEKDLDYLNPMTLFRDRHPKVKAFKTEVFNALQPIYEKDKSAEFLGTIPRQVSRVVKKIYNDPSSDLVDREFLQNEIKKLHYLDVRNLEDFIENSPTNSKNEISTVGYLSGETHTLPKRSMTSATVSVLLDGYVTFAGNKNLVTGKLPTPEELETYKGSGVPKLYYMEPDSSLPKNPTALGMIPAMALNLTNHINNVLNAVILDRETFTTASQRIKKMKAAPWNEVILDNWKIKALVLASSNLQNIGMVQSIGKKYGLPVLFIDDI